MCARDGSSGTRCGCGSGRDATRPLRRVLLCAALLAVLASSLIGALAPHAHAEGPELSVETVVTGLTVPWGIAFAPDATMLFTERHGVLSARLTDGTVLTVNADMGDLYARSETGLMAILVDPGFASNRRFYTCQGHTGLEVQVIAWTMSDGYTSATRVADPLVGGIPASSSGRHGGCRLRFGPDGYLWIATGDAKTGTVPQDLASPGGKVLRVDASTGAGAPTNPFAPSAVYSYGHRNVQGLALRPGTDQMWAVEHGPSVDDEINLLVAGGNYGWNPVPGYNQSVPMTDRTEFPDAIPARWSSGSPTLATSGGAFLEGRAWGEWEGRLAVATLKAESLRVFEFAGDGTLLSQLTVPELDGHYGRLRTPVMGPDGALYVSTSNGSGGDRILRIVPGASPISVTPPPVHAAPPSGGGASRGPEPGAADFAWNVTHDIEALDTASGAATGLWGDGDTLWVAQNGNGANDALFAYDPGSRERAEDREFALAETNHAPKGLGSDGVTMWISDSGQNRLFAYVAETGERAAERDIVLADDNGDARGIWSDDTTMWVLDDHARALFGYDLASGELLAEYALDSANDDPHGIWSDRVTVWVSNHDPKRLFAYRLPVPPDDPPEDPEDLERVRDEEFGELPSAGNNSPRGIWSDGGVMYVADANDSRVYSYNMPDAIDARLASLALSGIDFGEFSPLRYDYASDTIPHGNIATLTATAAQSSASREISPADHDGDEANGYQVRLIPGREITITVTSPDGSRTRVYRLLLGEEEATGPAADCLRGIVDARFSLVTYEGGSTADLEACAEHVGMGSLYVRLEDAWVSLILGAPEFVNRALRELFAEGVPADTPMIAQRADPDSGGS